MKNTLKLKIAVLGTLAITSCTKLDEEQFGKLSVTTYYKTPAEALSSVAGVYSSLSQVAHIGDPWRIAEFSSDEFLVPGRASGGWFDQNNIDVMMHNAKPDNQTTGRAWTNIFTEIGLANAVIENLKASSGAASFTAEIAETRALRAYGYFYAMDFWGNVPLSTASKPDVTPGTTARADVFKFVESEFLAAANDLPSVKTVTKANYYPRLTKEAVYTALATLYLNAEVYTGTQRWNDALTMCNNVINTGAYNLEANVVDCFKVANKGKTNEVIFSFSVDPSKNAGGNQFILYAQPALDQQRYNLPFAPANGYSTYQEALDRYESQDNRKKLIEYGPQTYANGSPLVDSKGVQLNLVAVQSLTAALDNEGYRVLKYVPDGVTWSSYNANNDLILTRYSDILLMKAEALFRTGDAASALILVNQVRTRSNATVLTTLTLQNIEDERAREFIWEGHRRRDMIRFGSYFTKTWAFKTTADNGKSKGIYPIPSKEIASNPKLQQNPGY